MKVTLGNTHQEDPKPAMLKSNPRAQKTPQTAPFGCFSQLTNPMVQDSTVLAPAWKCVSKTPTWGRIMTYDLYTSTCMVPTCSQLILPMTDPSPPVFSVPSRVGMSPSVGEVLHGIDLGARGKA